MKAESEERNIGKKGGGQGWKKGKKEAEEGM